MEGPVTLARPAASHDATLKTLGPGALLVGAGLLLLLAAFRGNSVRSDAGALLPYYCLGLIVIALLLWWEATRRRTGVLPSWTSPPAVIAAWALAWIYLPALAPFFDADLFGEFESAQGGESVLVTGLALTCVALATLSLGYHATVMVLGRRDETAEAGQRTVAIRRVIGLYVVSTVARGVHLLTVGVAYGTDITAWGALQPVAQWIGYVEDLRFLALALLVAHVIHRRTGYVWLAIPIVLELVLGVSSGFLTPAILPLVLCVTAAAALDRLRARHLALIAAVALLISTFVPVIAAIREDRMGAIGTTDFSRVADALATPGKYWVAGVSAGNGIYDKFFGRQTEVASAAGLVVALTPAVVPYEGLERFLVVPLSLIPRAIWPDKPSLSRGVWFSSTFRGLATDTTSYSAMTIFSEGYLFYGWTGTVLAMLILGSVLALIRSRLDNPRLALVYLALVPTILQIEPEFSSYVITLVQRTVVFIVVFFLFSYTTAKTTRRQQIST
jgi:hypothetical protein